MKHAIAGCRAADGRHTEGKCWYAAAIKWSRRVKRGVFYWTSVRRVHGRFFMTLADREAEFRELGSIAGVIFEQVSGLLAVVGTPSGWNCRYHVEPGTVLDTGGLR